MADPLSIGASIVAFLQIADSVLRVCKYYMETAKDAPRDILVIFGEITSLRAILDGFNSVDVSRVPQVFETGGPVDACRRCLLSLEALLPRMPADGERQRKFTLRDLAWPLKETKARKLLAEISQQKSTLILALTGDMARDIKDIKSGVSRLEQTLTDSERYQVLHWLESKCKDPSTLHGEAFRKHEPHTSAWLPNYPEWIHWVQRTAPNRFTWVHGIPGSGKTVLASFIIEQVKSVCHQSPGYGYSYYYCHHSHNHDEGLSFLHWVVGQLCRQAKWVPHQLKELYDLGTQIMMSQLEDILQAVLEKFDAAYVVIDAVDESFPRDNLLALIARLASDRRFSNLSILATSREYFDIEKTFSSISSRISMSNEFVQEDIRLFVQHQLRWNTRLKRWGYILDKIESALTLGAQGMFRWVVCQIHVLERLREESQIFDALKNLPKDLGQSYIRVFETIPDHDRAFVRRVLLWIAGHSGAPWLSDGGINSNVLLAAVAHDLDIGKPGYNLDDLMELCGCLISAGDDYDCHSECGLDASVERVHQLDTISTERDSGDSVYSTEPWDVETLRDESNYNHDQDAFVPRYDSMPGLGFPGDGCISKHLSIAHYTVMEFLQSSHISQSTVAYFALSKEEMRDEFTRSVYRQAMGANPMGSSADWVGDREAYCLTLSCALDARFKTDEDAEFFIQYYNPAKPHAQRFRRIQERIVSSPGDASGFVLASLAVQVPGAIGTSDEEAITLLNILTAGDEDLALAFARNRRARFESILQRNVSWHFFGGQYRRDSSVLNAYEGNIWEILDITGGGDLMGVTKRIALESQRYLYLSGAQ